MFLFLSKLLPLFVYPLGLACLLLLITLGLAWRRSRWTPLPVALALTALLLAGNAWVSQSLVGSLEWQYRTPATALPTAEAIVVLGGATRSAVTPRPTVEVNEAGDRVIYAAQLYHAGKAPLIIASGGRIPWLGVVSPESADMVTLLALLGVPRDAIVQDPHSLNTYQNAVNVRAILDQRGLNRVLLVTSAMHMPRSLLVFKKQGIEAVPAPTDFLVTEFDRPQRDTNTQAALLNALPDANHLAKTTKALKEYIGMLVYRLRGWL